MRVGQGIDVHAFDPSLVRPLRIAGVEITEGPPLAGHSDADVALHALVDALLGAAALGDLGSLIGIDQPETLGQDSSAFVSKAVALVNGAGLRVSNIDLTILAQRPRLSPYRLRMRQRIAELTTSPLDRVSVKLTTTDHLGFIGRAEGICGMATVLLIRPGSGPEG